MPKLITLAEDAYNDLIAGVENLFHEAETLVEGLDQHHASAATASAAAATGSTSVPPVTPAPTASSLKATADTLKSHLASGALAPVQALAASTPKPAVFSHVHKEENAPAPVVPGTPPVIAAPAPVVVTPAVTATTPVVPAATA